VRAIAEGSASPLRPPAAISFLPSTNAASAVFRPALG
jgi:hypothetical protein